MARNNPPLPPLTFAVIRYTVQTTYLAQIYESILDYIASGPVTLSPTVLGVFDTNWRTANLTDFLACISQDAMFVRTYTADLRPATTPTVVNASGPTAGTVASHPLPGPVAAILTKRTNIKGQHGRGRMMMPWVGISFTTPATDPNVLNNTAFSAYNAFIAAITVPVAAGGANWTPSVITRPVPPAIAVTNGANIESWTVQSILGTVRRRREGRGI